MPKRKKQPDVAGENESNFTMRLPGTLHKRFIASCRAGGAGRVSGADALRGLMEMRIAFTEANRRQPISLVELCQWYLAEQKKLLEFPSVGADPMASLRAAETEPPSKSTPPGPSRPSRPNPPAVPGGPRPKSTRGIHRVSRKPKPGTEPGK